jgi:uncharacterized protein (DUF2225 family)
MAEINAPDLAEVRRRLGIFLGQNQTLVERYLQVHGPKINMKAIQDLREEVAADSVQSPIPITNVTEPQDTNTEPPVFSIELECPCCRTKAIVHRELRASAMSIKNDAFLAPVYFPVGKYAKLNYLSVSVSVCPRCFFASPDKKDFIQFNRTTRQQLPSQLSAGILSEIQDSLAERQEMVESAHIDKDFTVCPRPLPLAILSYRLADQRARIEAESKNPFAIYKRASYWTRIALLQRMAKLEDTQALEQALALFKESFYRTDFPNANCEFQSCFIIFSIYLRFGQEKQAREYVTVMEQGRKEVEERKDPNAAQALSQWLGMTKARWEERDNPQIWEIPH